MALWTLVGGTLRLWSLRRLGLVHFDEGIYAIAGLVGLDPSVIPYAPPGFPFLIGLAYDFLGAGDVSAILVSIVAGTLTIPAVGWLASRTFGRGAGGTASAFVAFSGPHIAFSRMAMTDASFLLFWILAIGQGQRFLERHNFPRAVMLGVAVGLSQLFKYNGWLAGLMVAFSALAWPIFRRDERTKRNAFALWGWGLFAAFVAAIVYWPWFRFVEAHGSYRGLMAHHRSYVGGVSSWPGHLVMQLAQEERLSGGIGWRLLGGLAAVAGLLSMRREFEIGRQFLPCLAIVAFGLTALSVVPHVGLWIELCWIIPAIYTRWRDATTGQFLLLVGWAMLTVLTPFYHPYARLWLPIQAFGWIFLGGSFLVVRRVVEIRYRSELPGEPTRTIPLFRVALLGELLAFVTILIPTHPTGRLSELLQPSDSLRRGCRTLSSIIPRELGNLRVYARPPVRFYLSQRVGVSPQPSLEVDSSHRAIRGHGPYSTWRWCVNSSERASDSLA